MDWSDIKKRNNIDIQDIIHKNLLLDIFGLREQQNAKQKAPFEKWHYRSQSLYELLLVSMGFHRQKREFKAHVSIESTLTAQWAF